MSVGKKDLRRVTAMAANDKGTVAIEFAMVASLFLMILFGIIAFGFQFATRIALTSAVAEGGRSLVSMLPRKNADPFTDAQGVIRDVLDSYKPLIDPDRALISITPLGIGPSGMRYRVSIAYSDSRFSSLPFVPSLSDLPPVETIFIYQDPSS